MQETLRTYPDVETEELDSAWREFLQYQRLALSELLTDRGITEDIFSELSSRIDDQLASSEIGWNNAAEMDRDLWQLHPPPPELETDPD